MYPALGAELHRQDVASLRAERADGRPGMSRRGVGSAQRAQASGCVRRRLACLEAAGAVVIKHVAPLAGHALVDAAAKQAVDEHDHLQGRVRQTWRNWVGAEG